MRVYPIYLALILLACQDPIDFELAEEPDYIIIDGFITDSFGPHYIDISQAAQYTSVLEGGLEPRVPGATVCIRDDAQNCVDLVEVQEGRYATPDTFRGIPGTTYTLQVNTSDGGTYVSTPELLTAPGIIDTVYLDSIIVENVTGSNVLVDRMGLQFYVDFTFPGEDYYYLWDWESTFILKTYYDGGMADSCFVDEWPIEYLNILESNSSTSRKVERHPIVFKDIDFRFSRGFSLNVQQYAVSRGSYEFHNSIRNQLESNGSIFDPAPARINGNLSNPNNEDEIVLGYFGAYGLTEKRMFVDSLVSFFPSLTVCLAEPMHTPPNYCFDCSQYEIGGNFNSFARRELPEFWEL